MITEISKVINVGAGAGQVFAGETVNNNVNLKTIAAGSNITITNNATDINIAANLAAGFPSFWTEYFTPAEMYCLGNDLVQFYNVQKLYSGVGGSIGARAMKNQSGQQNEFILLLYPQEFIKYSDPKFKIRIYWSADSGTGNNQTFRVAAKHIRKGQRIDGTDVDFPANVTWTEVIASSKVSGIIGADTLPYKKGVAFTPSIAGGETYGPGYYTYVRVAPNANPAQDLFYLFIEIQYQVDKTFANVAEWPT